ncbi:MAG: hypothetical protein LBH43_16485 [Treponema sp.]|jgi:hypothetical protein|nr:hypothetical protein [Treponema sp.]
MIQIYFLSIFFNVLSGYFLISGEEEGVSELRSKLSLSAVKDETFKLILGILTMVIGLLKLLSPIEGDIPILGDLVPAAAGFAAGFILVYEYYKGRALEDAGEGIESLSSVLIRNKKIIGFVVIAAAALHFLFPRALFL